MVCSTLAACLVFATQFSANTFGYGELSCMRENKIASCSKGNRTASGEFFDPSLATIAIWLPRNFKLRPQWISLKLKGQTKCIRLWLNDRKGKKGFDLTPGALKALGVKPVRSWSGRLQLCKAATVAFK